MKKSELKQIISECIQEVMQDEKDQQNENKTKSSSLSLLSSFLPKIETGELDEDNFEFLIKSMLSSYNKARREREQKNRPDTRNFYLNVDYK